MNLTYRITEKGYRILLDGKDWIAQEDGYIPYPKATREESAQAHIGQLLSMSDTTEEMSV